MEEYRRVRFLSIIEDLAKRYDVQFIERYTHVPVSQTARCRDGAVSGSQAGSRAAELFFTQKLPPGEGTP